MKKALIGAGVLAVIVIAQVIHGYGVIVGHAAAMRMLELFSKRW